MYLSFEEYINMGGTLELPTFNSLEVESEYIINYYTFNRTSLLEEYPEALKLCVLKLIEVLNIKKQSFNIGATGGNSSPVVTSFSNDGASVSYNSFSVESAFSTSDSEIKHIIKHYLTYVKCRDGNSLLYRGVF